MHRNQSPPIRLRLAVLVLIVSLVLGLAGPVTGQEFNPMGGLSTTAGQPTVTVVQCNPMVGGAYTEGKSGKCTWDTAKRFARLIAKDCPDAAVIGMEEVIGADQASKNKEILDKATGKVWEFAFESQGVNDASSGLAIFWRKDRVAFFKKLGKTEIERLDEGGGYRVRFMGVLLREVASGKPFGVFTGKITWDGGIINGHGVTEKDRVKEAKRLKDWIRQVMASCADAPRIIAMDMNSPHGSPTYKEMNAEYENDGSDQATHDSLLRVFGRSIMRRKLDYLWYDADAGARRSGGFASRAVRSEHFGSDHRAIWAKVRLTGRSQFM
ncbi:MAG: hypothetical protein HY814_08215 [Candidatus Riflebacteria bacterium]|nr:hypothetical protein [Candidatus Riflebacteria bacterium]